jgi:hypothetical protein
MMSPYQAARVAAIEAEHGKAFHDTTVNFLLSVIRELAARHAHYLPLDSGVYDA